MRYISGPVLLLEFNFQNIVVRKIGNINILLREGKE